MTDSTTNTPPEPLRDGDLSRDRAARLLASVDGWASMDDALAERRVWRRLNEARPARRRSVRWRPALAASALVLASGAVAGATVGREFLRVRIEQLLDRAPEPEKVQRRRLPRQAPTITPAPVVAPPSSAPRALAPEPRRPTRVAARPAARPVAPPHEAPAPTASTEEGRLVMDAALALRRQASPARARELLDRYVARHPSGVLLEEALALAMEAAETPEGARTAARRYLDRFPNGRFAPVARETLSATAPR